MNQLLRRVVAVDRGKSFRQIWIAVLHLLLGRAQALEHLVVQRQFERLAVVHDEGEDDRPARDQARVRWAMGWLWYRCSTEKGADLARDVLIVGLCRGD